MIAVSFETATWENRGRPRSYWLESMQARSLRRLSGTYTFRKHVHTL